MEVKGLNSVISNLRKYGKEAERDIAAATEATARDIESYAKATAPANFGKLRQSILAIEKSEFVWEIGAGGLIAPYAPYVEFGTGPKVSVPAELQSIASKFKGKGKGSFEDGLESIKVWCRAKGIDEKNAFVILMSLIKNGQTPQPYLYPSLLRGRKEYVALLTKRLKKYGNVK